MTTSPDVIEVQLTGDFAPNRVLVKGDGPPVVFLHGLLGQEWPAYLDDLSSAHRVFAPEHPGATDSDDLLRLDGFWDLALYYDELFDQLGLERFDLVGHSFGGMVAAEFAATFNDRVRRLVLIGALGLWLEDSPVEDHLLVSPDKRNTMLYHDATAPEVAVRLAEPATVEAAQEAFLDSFSGLASTAHFIHPIPERGLSRRIHRIQAPTLVIWGRQDGLVPARYALEFGRLLTDAQVEIIDGAAHYPYLEQREITSKATLGFLG